MKARGDRVDAALRDHGVRLTEPRRTILDAALRMKGHFTADELLERMRAHGASASKATVYRTLTLLVDKGLLEPREFERGSLRYEVAAGADHHDHMICTACGTVHEFVEPEIERLQAEAAARFGFLMLGHSHRIFGLCARCVARGREPGPGPRHELTASPPPVPGRRGPRRARPA
jgi:Fur family ferric uptake transcriptional regulator